MIKKLFQGMVMGVCLFFLTPSAWADDGWPSLPNPFGKSTTSSKSKSSGSLLGSKQPKVIDQIGEGTKKVATTTWDFITLKWLWSPEDSKTTPQSPKLYDRRKSSSISKNSSGLNWWNPFATKKDSSQPKTLGEWMSQKRPEP